MCSSDLSPPDMAITQWRNGTQSNLLWDKLRGFSTTAGGYSEYLRTPSTGGGSAIANYFYIPDMVNFGFGAIAAGSQQSNGSGETLVGWSFARAPSFFDEVCYTGTGAVRTLNHNLAVAPEMMIVKVRGANSGSWRVYHSALGPTKLITLNLTNAAATLSTIWKIGRAHV